MPTAKAATDATGAKFMTAWCHGAPGIGLARLDCLPHLGDAATRAEIQTALATTLAEGFGMNHSLCDGDLGNLELLLHWHDQAMFHGIMFTGVDLVPNLHATQEAAKQALGLFAVSVETEGPPVFGEGYTQQETDALTVGCYECLLAWAEAVAQENSPHQAAHALKILDRAPPARLADPTDQGLPPAAAALSQRAGGRRWRGTGTRAGQRPPACQCPGPFSGGRRSAKTGRSRGRPAEL